MSLVTPRRIRWNVGVRAAVAVLCTFLFIAPVLWMVTTAFKTGTQAFSADIQWFFTPTLENFAQVLGGTRLTYALINSIQVSVISSVVAILLASGIAYPLARYDFK